LVHNCHQLTKDFQNALLKPLEDTPNHVYFFLCTTDPDKLLKTIKGRCTPFEVKKLNEKESTDLIHWVHDETETTRLDKETMKELYYITEGSPREALVMLDKIIDLDPKQQLEVLKSESIEENKDILDLSNALIKKQSWSKIIKILRAITAEDPEKVRRSILGLMNYKLMKGDNPKAALIMECFKEPFYNTGRPGLTMACYEAAMN